MTYRENIEWCDIWVSAARETAHPRILLIGDSITRAYYPNVEARLPDRYACARIASSKCVADPTYLNELDMVLNEYTFSVIHINNGLHGWDYDETAYGSGLAKAFDALVAHCGAVNVIWGSTTPVYKRDDHASLDAKTERVRERNNIAAALADERDICVNDLFASVFDRPELFSNDGVHFLETGQIVLGNCVADTILNKVDNSSELIS